MSTIIRRATVHDASGLAHMLRGLDLFAQVRSETAQNTQERPEAASFVYYLARPPAGQLRR